MQVYHKVRRFMKMAVMLVSVVALLSSSSLPVFAATNQQSIAPQSTDSSVTVRMTLNTVAKPGIQPDITVSGDGGIAKLNWMDSYQGLNWAVEPSGLLPGFEFVGDISIVYTNGKTANIPVSGYGVLGVSNTEPVTIYHGTSLTATLTGVATDSTGDSATVVPGCTVTFFTP